MPIPKQDVSKIVFREEITLINNGKARLKRDSDGYYKDVPLAVLGATTDNKSYYDVPTFVQQITSPQSFIKKLMKRRQLYGEFGHPNLTGLKTNEEIFARLLEIREDRWSHHYKSIGTGPMLESGGRLILGDLKPFGKFADVCESSLNTPTINTGMSLRSITSEKQIEDISFRTMKKLVTFDFVGAGGSPEASKEFSPGLENLDLKQLERDQSRLVVSMNEGRRIISTVSMERFTKHELNDIFGSKDIVVLGKEFTLIEGTSKLVERETERCVTAAQLLLRK